MSGVEPITWELIFYIASFAFQVAGAILLMIRFWGNTKSNVLKEYFPGDSWAELKENEKVELEDNKLISCIKTVYDTRASIICIIVGYICAVFGETQGNCKICVLMFIVLATIAVLVLENIITIFVAKLTYKKFKTIDVSDIESDILTEMSGEDVINYFRETDK